MRHGGPPAARDHESATLRTGKTDGHLMLAEHWTDLSGLMQGRCLTRGRASRAAGAPLRRRRRCKSKSRRGTGRVGVAPRSERQTRQANGIPKASKASGAGLGKNGLLQSKKCR